MIAVVNLFYFRISSRSELFFRIDDCSDSEFKNRYDLISMDGDHDIMSMLTMKEIS